MFKCNLCGIEANNPLPLRHGIFTISLLEVNRKDCNGIFELIVENNNNEKDSICK